MPHDFAHMDSKYAELTELVSRIVVTQSQGGESRREWGKIA
jgi:hypothetical protein